MNARRPALPAGVALLTVLLALLVLPACSRSEEAASSTYEPAAVKEIKGSDVSQVSFTRRGASLVDLRTATVQALGTDVGIPYAALIYDGQGASWVYTATKPLTFVRVPVTVAEVDGQQVRLSAGLEPGTQVVTVGATEVYGAELGIAGGH